MRLRMSVLLSLAGVLSVANAQTPDPPQAKLPPAIERALERFAKDPTATAKMLETRAKLAPQPTACSVPLLEMRVDHPQWFAIRRIAPPRTRDAMPQAALPAPPCESAKP
jgi:hypothetical protein